MDYKVRCYKGEKLERFEVWSNYPLEKVQLQALKWVNQGEADRVHVRDGSGKLVVRYPARRN